MTSTLELSCDTFRCEIAPALGGSIAGLWLGDIPVLRSTPAKALTMARQAGSYPLVKNNADAAWPFAFDTSQAFRLTANELGLTLSITNQSAVPAPVGLGWHPYFVKRARSRISFEATGRWEMSADKLPTHRVPAHGLDADCAFLDIDHCFDGWPGVVHLRDEQLHTRITSSLNRLVVFTHSTRDFVAIEPVSHANNAINLMTETGASADALGVHVLQAGESMSAEMSIHVERVK